MNTQKTPEQWFQILKEPYKTNALKAIVFNRDKKFDSLIKALMNSTNWILAGFEEIVTSLNKGETTYLEPETLKLETIELRQEEPTDWKAMYNELKAKYDQLEPKGEKVYFYLDKEKYHWRLNVDKQIAIDDSENHKEIYEAVKIGVKKSVLVNE